MFLTGDLEERVILDIRNNLGRPKGKVPESLVMKSFHLTKI